MADRIHPKVYAVVLVGGKGKRLRPLSANAIPKAFLSVTRNRRTMFWNTLNRISGLVSPDHIVVVANKAHSGLVKKDLPTASHKNILLEPASRNTAPAIALAGRFVMEKDEDAIMAVLPADHYIPDIGGYLKALGSGINFVANNDNAIVVIGLKPTFPSTEYGYIRAVGSGRVAKVKRFTEKPDLATARRYVSNGAYLWNEGIFIFKAGTLLAAVRTYAPKILRCLNSDNIDQAYRKMPDISIDYAIMEKARNISVVRTSYEWSDLGSFDALEKSLRKESRRYIKKNGKIIKIL